MAHVATVTIDHTKVAADLTDYVVAVIPDTAAGWADLYALCLEGGGDIRVYKDDDTTELPREIVTFSASGETGEIHIKYTGTLSGSVDTDIHIYADGSSADYAATDTYGRNAVWSAYKAVYHFQANSNDSTASGLNGTDTSVSYGAQKLKNGADLGTSSRIATSNVMATALTNLTIQMWINPDSLSGYRGVFQLSNNTGSGTKFLWLHTNAAAFKVTINNVAEYTPNINLSTSTWALLHFVKNGNAAGNANVYKDATIGTAVSIGTLDAATGWSSLNTRYEGSYNFQSDAKYDELRVRESVLSQDWITTEYNNQNSPATFYAVAVASSGSAYTQDLEEVVTGNDSIRRDTTKTHEEAGTANDTIVKGKASRYVENVNAADTTATLLIKLQTLLESVNITETFTRAMTKAYAEAVGVADTIRKETTKLFSEIVEATASATALTATYVQTLLETVTASDSISRLVGYVRSFTETVTTNDYFRIALNGINALWSDLYTDTADAWSNIYNDTPDAWSDKYIDN